MSAEKKRSTIEIIYELKEEIIAEAKKIARGETISAYALVEKSKELIALEATQAPQKHGAKTVKAK